MIITIHNETDIARGLDMVVRNAATTVDAIRAIPDTSINFLSQLKFGKLGLHPLEERPINFVEQLNQTFTYLTALKAAEMLLQWHPDCGGLILAPGAHAPKGSLDIESLSPALIGAETFSATSPNSNQKLKKDLDKLAIRPEQYRYVFFTSPLFPKTERLKSLERNGVQVWSVELNSQTS